MAGSVHASFLPAAQPDIIRAAQKDDYYQRVRARLRARQRSGAGCTRNVAERKALRQVLQDALQDVSRRWLGARRAIAVHDEARALAGGGCALRALRRVSVFVSQVSLLAAVLFHAVTTGAGVPTLGEEYCDLHLARGARHGLRASSALLVSRLANPCAAELAQVAGAEQRPVSLPRRALLVALQTAVPYWLERERCAAARCGATRKRTR